MKYLLTLIFLFTITVTTQAANHALYISLGGENKIACYTIGEKNGKLTHLEDVKTDGSPGAMCSPSSSGLLFVALRKSKSIATFRVNHETGKLKWIATKKVGVNPVYLSTDNKHKYLFLASYSEGKIAKFPLSDKGELLDKGSQWFDTERTAHSIQLSPDNKYLFVPHTKPNVIYQFQFNKKTGKLTRNKKRKISAPKGAGPRHYKFSEDGNFVYTADELGSSASVYRLDKKTGELSHLQTLSTLPENFKGKNTCAEVRVLSFLESRFLYVSNRGHDSIAAFSINQKTGKLTSLGQTPTERKPRSFNFLWFSNDHSESFLYAAGQSSGKLATYLIDPKTGKLKYLRTQKVGKSPSWVEVIYLGQY